MMHNAQPTQSNIPPSTYMKPHCWSPLSTGANNVTAPPGQEVEVETYFKGKSWSFPSSLPAAGGMLSKVCLLLASSAHTLSQLMGSAKFRGPPL